MTRTNHYIGKSNWSADALFKGKMDDVGVFNSALTLPEVEALSEPGAALTAALTGREEDLVYFNTFDFDGSSSHKVSRYLWTDSADNTLIGQTPGSTATYTWDTQNLNGSIKVQAFTNHGIESDTKSFSLKVYPALILSSDGPFVGKPNSPITLSGSFNEEGYQDATFSYQWSVQTDPSSSTLAALTASSEPETSYTWVDIGLTDAETVIAELSVTVTTTEGMPFTESHSTTVTLDAGTPTAEPGGPYRGGIAGGNFTPISLVGNFPDVIEDVNIGEIDAWHWTSALNETGLMFDGTEDGVDIDNSTLINEGSSYLSRTSPVLQSGREPGKRPSSSLGGGRNNKRVQHSHRRRKGGRRCLA